MKQQMPVFWGCTFTHNYPFLMKSTRAVLDAVGVAPVDVPEFGCCPDPIYVRAYGKDASLALSARNLAIAKKKGSKLLVVCNGCYNVLHEAKAELDDPVTRKAVNEMLPEDAKYPGGLEVVHLLSLLNSKQALLKTTIRKPLSGIKVAVHYGCHAIYPTAVPGDDPRDPRSMDDLVSAAGAISVDYESKLDCCGVPVAAFDKEEADAILHKKLSDIKKAGADCVVTACPACFMRFDMPPSELKDEALPVLHISELLCLALGIPATELFAEGHATKIDSLIRKIAGVKAPEADLIQKHFNCVELDSHCEACREECTAAVSTRNSDKPFDPLAPVEKLLAGKYYEAIRGEDVWRCLQCGKCIERCPNNLGLKDFYVKLRELSIAEGKSLRVIEDKVKMLEETGYGMPKRAGVRKRMGIAPAADLDSAPIKKILDKVREKRKK
jgi:heterodisulfide reductase subunit B/heterodisulfide reductase subunit C